MSHIRYAERMSLTARLVALASVGLLATDALGVWAGVGLLGWLLIAGATGPRVMATMVTFGLALSAGLTGVVARKHAANILLPSKSTCRSGFGAVKAGCEGGLPAAALPCFTDRLSPFRFDPASAEPVFRRATYPASTNPYSGSRNPRV